MQVNNKCTLMIDADALMRGEPHILANFLSYAFGVIHEKMTGSISRIPPLIPTLTRTSQTCLKG